jgi:hypothetical protein
MKTTILFALILTSLSSFAADGLTIGNSFEVGSSGHVFRGKEPKKLVSELKPFGITDVIIFKNDVRGEVVKEIAALDEIGIRSHHLPFRWKEFPSMVEACEQTVDALNIISRVQAANGKVFFHCTAGEDRTGMLAGILRMLEDNLSREETFREEMCARGYSDASSHKPYAVHSAIQKELTPLFIALAAKVERGEWRLGKISKKSCQGLVVAPTTLKCR